MYLAGAVEELETDFPLQVCDDTADRWPREIQSQYRLLHGFGRDDHAEGIDLSDVIVIGADGCTCLCMQVPVVISPAGKTP